MNVTKVFGNNIRRLRLAQGLSQEAVAERANLHRTYIGAVERGERNITLVNAHRIAGALGCGLAECLQGLNDDRQSRES